MYFAFFIEPVTLLETSYIYVIITVSRKVDNGEKENGKPQSRYDSEMNMCI